jgi:hypothetical protein
VSFVSDPPGADVYFDDENLDKPTDTALWCMPGRHRFHFKLDGYHDEKADITVKKDTPFAIKKKLRKK